MGREASLAIALTSLTPNGRTAVLSVQVLPRAYAPPLPPPLSVLPLAHATPPPPWRQLQTRQPNSPRSLLVR